MKKVSIIVPTYNAHGTLSRCLETLVHQTLQDIEIIVVNDASTDDTWEIMQEYESKYPDMLTIVNCENNSKAGGARNIGFDMATGEYIGMVDSDDYVSTTMYEQLYEKAKETGADIVDSGYYNESIDKAILTISDNLTGELNDSKRSGLIAGSGYLVTKIFKQELFNNPPVRMQQNMVALEDFEILIYMFLKAKSVATVKSVFYYYCDTASSGSKVMSTKIYFDSVYRAISGTYRICNSLPSYNSCKPAIEYMLTTLYSFCINRCLYDQIIKYGGDPKKIANYFNELAPQEKDMVLQLAKLKKEVITIPYSENKFTQKKLSSLDIEIMKECDRRFYNEAVVS